MCNSQRQSTSSSPPPQTSTTRRLRSLRNGQFRIGRNEQEALAEQILEETEDTTDHLSLMGRPHLFRIDRHGISLADSTRC